MKCPEHNLEDNKSKRKLLGFRSNKTWKKIISTSYLIFCVMVIIYTIFSSRIGKISVYDFIIDKVALTFLSICFISPYIFLSNTKIRNIIPQFKKRTIGSSICGISIVVLVLFIAISITISFHSEEYKNDKQNHDYVVKNEIKPSCIESGKTTYICEYCGIQYEKTLNPTGHKLLLNSRIEPTCSTKGALITKCTDCEYTETNEIDLIDHNWKTTENIEPTCSSNGKKVSTCSMCHKEKITTLPQIEHTIIDEIIEEATCEHPKKIFKKCTTCSYKETESIGQALPHNLYIDKIIEANCIHSKETYKKCVNCDYEEIDTTGNTTPHSYGNWTIEKHPTSESVGIQSKACLVCQHKISEEIKKISPITITKIMYSKDYLGGVEWDFYIKSNSEKTIKYIRIYWDCYNSVNDLVRDSITGKPNHSIEIVGPINYGSSGSWSNVLLFYNYNYDHMKITKIEVEFIDNTVIRLTEEDYSNIFLQ